MQLGTYQQWQTCFRRLQSGETAPGELLGAEIPALRLSEAAERAFTAELEAAVSACLTRACGRYSRALRETGEMGGLEEIPLLARRLRREVGGVLFIRRLTFLGADYREALEDAVRQQLDGLWADFLGVLRRQEEQTPSPELEELIAVLRRFRLLDE